MFGPFKWTKGGPHMRAIMEIYIIYIKANREVGCGGCHVITHKSSLFRKILIKIHRAFGLMWDTTPPKSPP